MFGTSALRDDAKRWRAKAEGVSEEGLDQETWRFVCEGFAKGYDEMADRHEQAIALEMMINKGNYPSLVLRSEHHESALWNADHPNGGYPYAPGHEHHEDYIWQAYTDLENAGLLRRAGSDFDIFRNGCLCRIKFLLTEDGQIALDQLKAFRDTNPE